MDYFEKIKSAPKEDLTWNIPEQKQGSVNIIGGNSKSFKTEIKIAEYLGEKYPVEKINLVLPDALKNSLPDLESFWFLPSTESGAFDDSQEFRDVFNKADFNLVLGDFSKNSITKKAITNTFSSSDLKRPVLVTRDAVDIIAENATERILTNENLVILASIPQLIKLLRAVYYPKMLLLSQSLIQVAEVLHKFTLSYPLLVVTLHNEQILVANGGKVKAVPLASSNYQPFSIWGGELAAKIVALNLYNPNRLIQTSLAAIFN